MKWSCYLRLICGSPPNYQADTPQINFSKRDSNILQHLCCWIHNRFCRSTTTKSSAHTLLLPLVFPKQTPVLAGGRWRAAQHFGRNHTIQEVYFFPSLTVQNSVNYNTSYRLNASDVLCAHVFVQHGELESEAGVCTFRPNN